MKWNRWIFITGFLFLGLNSCKNEEEETVDPENMEQEAEVFEEELSEFRERNVVVDAIEANPELSTFAAGLNVWNIEDALQKIEGPYTIFAPTNTAYSAVYGQQGYDVLDNHPDEVIPYHIVRAAFKPEELRKEIEEAGGEVSYDTLEGEEIVFSLDGDDIVLTGATGDKARVTGSFPIENGTAYTIDAVLLPEGIDTDVTITGEN